MRAASHSGISRELSTRMTVSSSLLQALTARVKLYELTCNMEPDAARVAFEGMGGMLT